MPRIKQGAPQFKPRNSSVESSPSVAESNDTLTGRKRNRAEIRAEGREAAKAESQEKSKKKEETKLVLELLATVNNDNSYLKPLKPKKARHLGNTHQDSNAASEADSSTSASAASASIAPSSSALAATVSPAMPLSLAASNHSGLRIGFEAYSSSYQAPAALPERETAHSEAGRADASAAALGVAISGVGVGLAAGPQAYIDYPDGSRYLPYGAIFPTPILLASGMAYPAGTVFPPGYLLAPGTHYFEGAVVTRSPIIMNNGNIIPPGLYVPPYTFFTPTNVFFPYGAFFEPCSFPINTAPIAVPALTQARAASSILNTASASTGSSYTAGFFASNSGGPRVELSAELKDHKEKLAKLEMELAEQGKYWEGVFGFKLGR